MSGADNLRPPPKLWPYKVLVWLLYSPSETISRLGQGRILLRTNALAEELNIKRERLLEYLAHLQDEMGIIESTSTGHGYIVVQLRYPKE